MLDRICRLAPRLLAPGGMLLVVQSSLARPDRTLAALRRAGLDTAVVATRRQAFGPVMTARARWFEASGVIGADEREELLVVIRGVRPA